MDQRLQSAAILGGAMASFDIATNTQSGQFLGTGEFGLVASSGSVLTALGPAVTLNGAATLVTYGALGAASASALVLKEATGTSVTIGGTGAVVSGSLDFAAISGSFSGAFALRISGFVSGGKGVTLQAAAFSVLTIGNDGAVQGLGLDAGQAIALTLPATSAAVITNTGTISAASAHPTIESLGAGGLTVSNTGTIANAGPNGVAIAAEGTLFLRNSGRIDGDVTATLSANIFTSGTLRGDIVLGSGNDTVRVNGLVVGDIFLGDGRGAYVQTGGRVTGCVYGGSGDDTYTVDRSDTAICDTRGGLDTVFASSSFRLSAGIENLTLTSALDLTGTGNGGDNVILGGGGGDVLWGLGGDDALNGGAGNNRLMGGGGLDTLRGGDGHDRLDGGPGADMIYVGSGNDTLLGGTGRDALRFDELSSLLGVTVNLSTNKASFEDKGSAFRFMGFEDVVGSAFGDALTGSAVANSLVGGGGADTLSGGDGDDMLVGGAQADVLYGGKGADHFVFAGLTDSLATGYDTIKDFEKAKDLLDLSLLDAVMGGADDAFRFIGKNAFSGNGAEVRSTSDAATGTTLIEVQVAGWARGDVYIVLSGLFDLTEAQFVL